MSGLTLSTIVFNLIGMGSSCQGQPTTTLALADPGAGPGGSNPPPPPPPPP